MSFELNRPRFLQVSEGEYRLVPSDKTKKLSTKLLESAYLKPVMKAIQRLEELEHELAKADLINVGLRERVEELTPKLTPVMESEENNIVKETFSLTIPIPKDVNDLLSIANGLFKSYVQMYSYATDHDKEATRQNVETRWDEFVRGLDRIHNSLPAHYVTKQPEPKRQLTQEEQHEAALEAALPTSSDAGGLRDIKFNKSLQNLLRSREASKEHNEDDVNTVMSSVNQIHEETDMGYKKALERIISEESNLERAQASADAITTSIELPKDITEEEAKVLLDSASQVIAEGKGKVVSGESMTALDSFKRITEAREQQREHQEKVLIGETAIHEKDRKEAIEMLMRGVSVPFDYLEKLGISEKDIETINKAIEEANRLAEETRMLFDNDNRPYRWTDIKNDAIENVMRQHFGEGNTPSVLEAKQSTTAQLVKSAFDGLTLSAGTTNLEVQAGEVIPDAKTSEALKQTQPIRKQVPAKPTRRKRRR